jgi:hypothetical protein
MSSGQALLQKLQARRLKVQASNGNNGIIDSGNKRSLPIRSTSADTDPPTLLPAATRSLPIHGVSVDADPPTLLPAAATATTFIEICQGPDCGGLGGGAALLEIEELVCEHVHKNNNDCAKPPILLVGGCRDFCTMGPNVYFRSKQINEHSFNHVDSTSRCADVVDSLVGVAGGGVVNGNMDGTAILPTPTNTTNSLVSRMAQRRSERLRWDALRQISRTSSSAQQPQQRRSDGATTATTTATSQDGTPQASTPLASSSSSSSTATAVPLQVPVLDTNATTTTEATTTSLYEYKYKSNDAIQEQLQAAEKAEMVAAGSNLEMRARAQRRSERLFRKMQ